jgi:hypothetical protein
MLQMSSIDADQKDITKFFPRGPEDWGQLLWQDLWAYKRMTSSKLDRLTVYTMFFGLLSGAPLFYLVTIKENIGFIDNLLVFLFFFSFASIFAMGIRIDQSREFPRRIYKKGIVVPKPKFTRVSKEEDFFIPFDSIKEIKIDRIKGSSIYITVECVVHDHATQSTSDEWVLDGTEDEVEDYINGMRQAYPQILISDTRE